MLRINFQPMTDSTFNLDAPPNFRGLHPDKRVRRYVRNLPHWRQDGATYFVTFNLADALPASRKAELQSIRRDWEHRNPEPRDDTSWTELARAVFRKVEKWMDAGYGKCWFRKNEHAQELSRSILHFHEQRYELGCFCVMANHCHFIIRPFDDVTLEDEVGSMKSVTSRFIGKHETLSGQLWQQECYDESFVMRNTCIGSCSTLARIQSEQECRASCGNAG